MTTQQKLIKTKVGLLERPHQGRWCYGKTPMETFLSSVQIAQEKYLARAS